MDIQAQRDLQLLNEVERDAAVTQRSMADTLDVALGLTNLYLKRLVRKGYIKATTIPRHRIKYLLTPQGMVEKTRLTYQYMDYSLTYYRRMRERLTVTLTARAKAGAKRIVICGTGELAELAYISLREMDLILVGFVDSKQGTFLSYPLWLVEALPNWDFDMVLIADLKEARTLQARIMQAGVPREKIATL